MYAERFPKDVSAVVVSHPMAPPKDVLQRLRTRTPLMVTWATDDRWGLPYFGPKGAAYFVAATACDLLSWKESDYDSPTHFYGGEYCDRVVEFLRDAVNRRRQRRTRSELSALRRGTSDITVTATVTATETAKPTKPTKAAKAPAKKKAATTKKAKAAPAAVPVEEDDDDLSPMDEVPASPVLAPVANKKVTNLPALKKRKAEVFEDQENLLALGEVSKMTVQKIRSHLTSLDIELPVAAVKKAALVGLYETYLKEKGCDDLVTA
eukprot:GFYU01017996.1.p1 GENE.GFYU01017996.1~~GFYU01017996.1.p1  ORF type:complete len:305 (-),score=114.95 GFYU01017996.1:56-850(-)